MKIIKTASCRKEAISPTEYFNLNDNIPSTRKDWQMPDAKKETPQNFNDQQDKSDLIILPFSERFILKGLITEHEHDETSMITNVHLILERNGNKIKMPISISNKILDEVRDKVLEQNINADRDAEKSYTNEGRCITTYLLDNPLLCNIHFSNDEPVDISFDG